MAHVAVFVVLHDIDRLPALLEAWSAAGIPGATVLESAGMHYLRTGRYRDDLPLIPSMDALLRGTADSNRTCFAIVEEDDLDALIAATEQALGPLDEPNTGILFVLPVLRVVGLVKWGQRPDGE